MPAVAAGKRVYGPAVTVCFTPGGNCTGQIVNAVAGAKISSLVQACSFTSAPIAKALLEAHKRAVQVQVILAKGQHIEKYSSVDFLANQGVPTRIDAAHAISHNKVMILDGGHERVAYLGIAALGPLATEANRRLVQGQRVWLELDAPLRDGEGRLLAYVYGGDLMVNAELVRLGHAQMATLSPHGKYQELFLMLQWEAREAR